MPVQIPAVRHKLLRGPSSPFWSRFVLAWIGIILIAGNFGRVGADIRPIATSQQTALDRYVAKADPTYAWKMVISVRDDSATGYALDLTSQTWRTTNEVNQPN